ncbi:GNAT family N-acetyltransferase [Scatolibacter rhodanostii]|uniref:GNAT family N-acetyltransferase n=1 Tax=Scatolibacter rhodanostii TaxID=2014781 RepID=UPI000C0841E6|nr:GNAT family N-acetyltransferase [Scatolibacter rhodanostii]
MFYTPLTTDRLILKNISEDDNTFMLEQFSNDDVNRFLYDAEPLSTLEQTNEIINFYLQPEPRIQHRWILILKETGEKIGTCGFHCWDKETHSVDIGYDLQKAYWNQGFMTEALRAIIDFAVQKMKIQHIHAHIYVKNEASLAIAKKLGFTFQGATEIENFRGDDYLHHIYTLDTSE